MGIEMKHRNRETKEECARRKTLCAKYDVANFMESMTIGWKPGRLIVDVPNRIGVEYKAGDEILINTVPNGVCFHLKTGLIVSFRSFEYQPI